MGIFDKLKLIWKVLWEAGNIGKTQQILDCQKNLPETMERLREKQKIIDGLETEKQKLEYENRELKNAQDNKIGNLMQRQFEKNEKNQWKNSSK